MITEFINEPELEFGAGFRHIDIRHGIMSYGPFDLDSGLAPQRIKIGLVGTEKTVERFLSWFDQCVSGIAAKESNKPNLFPRFPGIGKNVGLRCEVVYENTLIRTVNYGKVIRPMLEQKDHNQGVRDAVDVFNRQLEYLSQSKNATPDVLVCAPPVELFRHFEREDPDDDEFEFTEEKKNEGFKLDFHDLLKSASLKLRTPIQFVRPATYDPTAKELRKKGTARQLQDQATRAWNFFTALYYKAGGTPWRLVRDPSEFASCFVGISFYRSLDNTAISTSVAQVFNERGEGVILSGGPAQMEKDDPEPHLQSEDAYNLLKCVLKSYHDEHETLPARVVIHKSSVYTKHEREGFNKAITEKGISRKDFMTLDHSFTRFFRVGAYPPLRGTFINFDDERSILYTKGSVDFFKMYPGLYVPKTLLMRCQETDKTPRQLAAEILALTKLNWNNTQFDAFYPITLKAARQVGNILRHLSGRPPAITRYAYYM